ncbi:hypothetical protein F4815DRAFT_456603 [Daldinia loculata]|nr:hypothetical protein F4815DRAFT_456603 [Daldinia loculata]
MFRVQVFSFFFLMLPLICRGAPYRRMRTRTILACLLATYLPTYLRAWNERKMQSASQRRCLLCASGTLLRGFLVSANVRTHIYVCICIIRM